MSKIISIVIPSFNQVKFIDQTFESILSQEGDFYLDLIINDGGSTDGAVERIEHFEKLLQDNCEQKEINGHNFYINPKPGFKYHKCNGISYRWQSKKDKGQSDAINQGFRAAFGDITTWLNTDDSYLPGVLQTVVRAFNRNDIDVLVGNTIALDAEGKELWRQYPVPPTLFSLLYIQQTPQQPAIFFTKELIDRVEGVDESLHYVMDVDLWIRFCFAGAKFRKIEETYAIQIYHDASKSSQGAEMFEKFQPEDRMIKAKYKAMLGWRKYYYPIKLLWVKFYGILYGIGGKYFPKSLKNIINRVVTWKRRIL